MDPIELLILGVLAFAAYAAFAAPAPSSSSAAVTAQTTPTPTTTASGAAPATTISSAGSAATSSTPATTSTSPLPSSAVPPDSAFIAAGIAAYTQATGISSGKYYQNFVGVLTAALASMQMTAQGTTSEFSDNCSGVSMPNISFTQAAGLAGTAASGAIGVASATGALAASAAATAIPVIGIGIAIVSIVGAIFAHHAQKVKEQAQLDCAAVNAANNAWANIQQALASGQLTLAQAYTAWEAVYSQFAQMLQPMNNMGQGDCNNPCVFTLVCRQVTNKWEAMYGAS